MRCAIESSPRINASSPSRKRQLPGVLASGHLSVYENRPLHVSTLVDECNSDVTPVDDCLPNGGSDNFRLADQPSRIVASAPICSQGYNDAQRMGLTSGSKLGPYEIVSPLGAGGMGEVYCAQRLAPGDPAPAIRLILCLVVGASALDYLISD